MPLYVFVPLAITGCIGPLILVFLAGISQGKKAVGLVFAWLLAISATVGLFIYGVGRYPEHAATLVSVAYWAAIINGVLALAVFWASAKR